ncbi:MAG: nickel insertion protein, partial [Planctomycetota bacterium]
MKIAYFDCFAGAAGDMIAAAMLDAGLDESFLVAQLGSLGIEGLDIKISPAKRCGLTAVHFEPESGDQQVRHLADITELITQSHISDPAKRRAIEIFESLAQAES